LLRGNAITVFEIEMKRIEDNAHALASGSLRSGFTGFAGIGAGKENRSESCSVTIILRKDSKV